MQQSLKRGLHWFGSALAIAGMVFVATRLRNYGVEVNFTQFNIFTWLVVAALALIYGLADLLLALAWWHLLAQFGASTTRRLAIGIFGISQIAKYVPGNIFHLAGRQAIGMAAGLPGWPLAKSAVWELSLISAAGVLFSLLVLPLFLPHYPEMVGVVFFVVATGVFFYLLWRFFGMPVARAFGWYVIFLTISGLLFVGVIELLIEKTGSKGLPWLPLIGGYVLALLAGLVTPGAPAGVGVREAVMYALLHTSISQSDLLTAIVLARIVTVAGDLFFYVLALAFFRPLTKTP